MARPHHTDEGVLTHVREPKARHVSDKLGPKLFGVADPPLISLPSVGD